MKVRVNGGVHNKQRPTEFESRPDSANGGESIFKREIT
jgi:hypothetical protein